MKLKEIFKNIYLKRNGRKEVFTQNLDSGHSVYGEPLINWKGKEYRRWDPTRSKLAAAILKKVKNLPFEEGSRILYLGTATGTTVSHLSDVIKEGIIYGVDIAPRVMRDFLRLCERRKNIFPILADARKPKKYIHLVEEVDVIYVDVAQKEQAKILIKNANTFLKKGGTGILMVKSRSIDATKEPNTVYNEQANILKKEGFEILEKRKLDPFQKDHAIIVGRFQQIFK